MFGKKGLKSPAEDVPVTARVRTIPEIRTCSYMDTGNREYQQDAAYVTPTKKVAANKRTRSLGIVCDGMGGMADGGRASKTALEMIVQAFGKIENEPNINISAFFKKGIAATDRTICQFPKENGRGSGTTMVAVIVEDDHFYWASVGDSRIYLLHDGNLQRLTRDHNYDLRLTQMLAEGSITQEEYAAKRQKEALISFLGIGDVSLMDISTSPIPLYYGDTILLCSDGVTKTLTDSQIRQILVSDRISIEDGAKQLVEVAIHGNTKSQDNTSVVLMKYMETQLQK